MKTVNSKGEEMICRILDNLEDILAAIDQEIKDKPSKLVEYCNEKSKYSDKYVTLYHGFEKILNADFNDRDRIYYFIGKDNDGRHRITEGEL